MNKLIVLLPVGLLAACATKPENIPASYVSTIQYEGLSCDRLRAEASRVDAALSQASAQQRKARSQDTAGVLLLGLPVGSMTNNGAEVQVGSLKGQQDAIRQVSQQKGC